MRPTKKAKVERNYAEEHSESLYAIARKLDTLYQLSNKDGDGVASCVTEVRDTLEVELQRHTAELNDALGSGLKKHSAKLKELLEVELDRHSTELARDIRSVSNAIGCLSIPNAQELAECLVREYVAKTRSDSDILRYFNTETYEVITFRKDEVAAATLSLLDGMKQIRLSVCLKNASTLEFVGWKDVVEIAEELHASTEFYKQLVQKVNPDRDYTFADDVHMEEDLDKKDQEAMKRAMDRLDEEIEEKNKRPENPFAYVSDSSEHESSETIGKNLEDLLNDHIISSSEESLEETLEDSSKDSSEESSEDSSSSTTEIPLVDYYDSTGSPPFVSSPSSGSNAKPNIGFAKTFTTGLR